MTIVLPETEAPLQIVITDLSGRIIYNETANRSLINWDIRMIANGTYLITVIDISTQETFGTQKVAVQH